MAACFSASREKSGVSRFARAAGGALWHLDSTPLFLLGGAVMKLSSEERGRVHERVDRLLDGGRPHLVYTVLSNLITYESCMISRDPPVDYLSREGALNLEHERVSRRYEKTKARAHLALVPKTSGERARNENWVADRMKGA